MHLGIIKITHNRTAQPRYYHNAFYGRLFREPRRGGNSDFATTIWSFWIFAIDCSNAEFWTLCVCVCVRERGAHSAALWERERERGGPQCSVVWERGSERERVTAQRHVCVWERESQRSIVCVCERERVTAQHRVCVWERAREGHNAALCVRERVTAQQRHGCVCVREENTVIHPRLCASTYELHHSVCHATLFRSQTDGKTKEIINCL